MFYFCGQPHAHLPCSPPTPTHTPPLQHSSQPLLWLCPSMPKAEVPPGKFIDFGEWVRPNTWVGTIVSEQEISRNLKKSIKRAESRLVIHSFPWRPKIISQQGNSNNNPQPQFCMYILTDVTWFIHSFIHSWHISLDERSQWMIPARWARLEQYLTYLTYSSILFVSSV